MSQVEPRQIRSRRDQIVGVIFVAIALAFGWEATNYELGTALRMGPGFIPLTLAAILAILGALVFAGGLRSLDTVAATPIPWRGMALTVGAIVVFGALGQQLGLVPVVFVCTFAIALASRRNTLLSAAAIAAAMSALCWLIFKVGLGVTLPTFGLLFS